ncbi:type II toxin-antitoxin system VapC family toxin [Rhodohalobacter sp.]|uniref:type II toxin-antitoxin system VapC family toxin n=1 Tax=Rhodohalobacter sp. TaxID=1974210 RepID=UPI002ACD4388|nr:type II toxin-antitoxin system VapC family toxin [Rhodohalobacter sp.]MDZ7754858.1 type II toxin-antitoxin system VapC family toxin [Rhodohalobacter sp.]
MIVVDTNVIASMWVPNDMDEWVYKVLKKDDDWVAPLLWRSEFRNVLSIYLRKDILEFSVVLQATEEAEQLMDTNEFDVNSTQVMSLVSDSSCSAYDCEFVALADDLNVPLVTFDKKILREFPSIAIHPEDFAL